MELMPAQRPTRQSVGQQCTTNQKFYDGICVEIAHCAMRTKPRGGPVEIWKKSVPKFVPNDV
jgi:hypothetical protein